MNNLDRSISDNLKISRSAYAWGWMHYQQATDAVLMSELARKPRDSQARAFPHTAESALSEKPVRQYVGRKNRDRPVLTLVSA